MVEEFSQAAFFKVIETCVTGSTPIASMYGIYLHLVDFYGKCRDIYQSHGSYKTGTLRQMFYFFSHHFDLLKAAYLLAQDVQQKLVAE